MKKFIVIALTLGLAACGATPEEEAADMAVVQSRMPEGCELHYAGAITPANAHYPSRIFYTVCDGVTTVSETHKQQTGKTSHAETTVNVIR